jgi:Protein of unknown function (DUF3467)
MAKKQTQLPHKNNGTNAAKSVEGLNFVRTPEFRSIYANYIRVNFNPFEISILFGQAGVLPEKQDTVAIEMTSRVTMDVIEAKLLHQMLTRTIVNFESKYGHVAIPDDVKLPQEG